MYNLSEWYRGTPTVPSVGAVRDHPEITSTRKGGGGGSGSVDVLFTKGGLGLLTSTIFRGGGGSERRRRFFKAFSTLLGEFALDLSDFAFINNVLYYSSGFDPPSRQQKHQHLTPLSTFGARLR